jgi:DNA polymerase
MNFDHLGEIETDIAPQFPTTVELSDTKLVFCGEAPGATEVEEGIPFVGKAGQLLDEALREAGIERDACYVTNVFWKRPPMNKVDWFFAGKKLAEAQGVACSERYPPFRANYLLSRWENQLDRLAFELTSIQPKLVVAVGATALWALTGLDKITMFRGVVRPIRGGVKGCTDLNMLATFHPSYVLRNQSAYKDLVDDLKVAKAFVQ